MVARAATWLTTGALAVVAGGGLGCGGGSSDDGTEASTALAPKAGDPCEPTEAEVAQLPFDLDCGIVSKTIVAEGEPCVFGDPEGPTGVHLACDPVEEKLEPSGGGAQPPPQPGEPCIPGEFQPDPRVSCVPID